MKKDNSSLYIAWAVLYGICGGLSFLSEPQGPLYGLMVVCALLFFVPPAMLLYRSIPRKQWGTVRLVRNLSIASLSLTLVLLVLTVLSAGADAAAPLGMLLQVLLILVSNPMICGQAWVLSLFLWAVLLMVCLKYRKAMKQ